MNRRGFLLGLGSAAVLGVRPGRAAIPTVLPAPPARAVVHGEAVRLYLRHTWTTVMASSTYRDTFHVAYARDGITGRGEGAPIVRYKESAASAQQALEVVRPLLETADPMQYTEILARIGARLPGEFAAKCAVDLALTDWVAQRLGVPLYRMLGLDPARAPVTTMSIGIDTPEITRQKVLEAAAFPVLKIKVGLSSDEATIAAVRSVTQKPLRVDANEGWKDREEAIRKIRWLETQNVEFIEQPLAAERTDDIRYVRSQVRMPIFADEACRHAADIPKLAGAYDGVVIKLDKCGGVWEALRMIHVARAHGLKVMLGCMISSSVVNAAAAQISPLADYADLDGFMLIRNDPYESMTVERGRLLLPDRPGLGLRPRPAGRDSVPGGPPAPGPVVPVKPTKPTDPTKPSEPSVPRKAAAPGGKPAVMA